MQEEVAIALRVLRENEVVVLSNKDSMRELLFKKDGVRTTAVRLYPNGALATEPNISSSRLIELIGWIVS